jgi:hypothetical protein
MKRISLLICSTLLAVSAAAQATDAIKNWSAPSTWTPPSTQASGRSALVVYPAIPFIPITPCRLADIRAGSGFPAGYGPPAIASGATRNFTITGQCGIPANALAVSFNFAVWAPSTRGDMRVFPAGGAAPVVSTLNWEAGILALANAAVVPLSPAGAISVLNDGTTPLEIFVDVNGYYTQLTSSGFAVASSGTFGLYGTSASIGVFGVGPTTGVQGVTFGTGLGVEGVLGTTVNGIGVKGHSDNTNGMWAESTNFDALAAFGGRDGTFSQGGRHGVFGVSSGTSGILFGVAGQSASATSGSSGVWGVDASGAPANWDTITRAGVTGVSIVNSGVLGVTQFGSGIGVRAVRLDNLSPFTVLSQALLTPTSGVAAQFFGSVSISTNVPTGSAGNLAISGTLSKGAGTFKIDHPLDPENKYLYHSFVESPDMMNIYNGIVELDAQGEAIVPLPAYFEALNSDFRYQLTSIGRAQPSLYIADEVQDLTFRIAGGKPHARVSWQVTGIRKDPFAMAHRVVPEVEKEAEAKGYYVHPGEYRQPAEKDIARKLNEVREAKETEQARSAVSR